MRRDTGQGEPRREELWMLKEEGCSCQKEGTIVNREDRKRTKSIYVCGRETTSGMGCVNLGWEQARRVLRRCIGARGSLDSGEGHLKRRSGKAVRCKRDDGDRVSNVCKVNV